MFNKKKITKAIYENGVLTITYSNKTTKQFQGKTTVWNLLPMMERCDTFEEGEFCSIYKYIVKWGNPYPTAHEKPDNEGKI